MSFKLVRLTTLGIHQEAVQNTPAARVAADYLHTMDVNIVPFVQMEDLKYYRTTLDRVKQIPGKKKYQISFKTPAKGSGTAGVKYAPLVSALEACQMASTVHAGVEAIGAAKANPDNLGVSPAPVVEIGVPAFNTHSGILELTLLSKTATNPEGATFQAIFYPGDNAVAPLIGQATISDAAFADVAFDGDLTKLTLTTGDPDAAGVGDPVSTWRVGDKWTFGYTSASQVDVELVAVNEASSANFFGPGKSCTIEVNINGLKHVAAGCLGKVKLPLTAGKTAMFEFSFEGLYAEATDEAMPTENPNTIDPPIFESSLLELDAADGGLTCIASKVEWDDGGELVEIEDSRSVDGLYGFMLTGRDPKGSIDPAAVAVSDYNFLNKVMTGAEVTLTYRLGKVAGNIIEFEHPKVQFDAPKYGDRNKIRTLDLPLLYNGDDADPWMTIRFK